MNEAVKMPDGSQGKPPAAETSPKPATPAAPKPDAPAQPAAAPAPEQAAKPAEKTEPKPAEKAETAPKPAPEPAPKPVEKPAAEKTAPTPVEKNAETPAPKPAEQPAPKPAAKPAETKAEDPDARPPVGAAKMRRRHRGLILSFLALAIMPALAMVFYLWFLAVDQYSSITGFTVRTEESNGASDLLGGLVQFAGSGGASDSNILFEFIQSPAMILAVEEEVGVRAHYSAHWSQDPIFSLWPDASNEDLEWYWPRVVRVSFDSGSGLTEIQVLAFDPDTAQRISEVIVAQSQKLINALNTQAREDAMGYARQDLAESVARLKTAREALTAFRSRTQIVDPQADLQGRMGVMNNLQQKLAEALIEYDLLAETARTGDPRVDQARRRIAVIRERIVEERRSFAAAGFAGDGASASVGQDYPRLLAEYEGLVVDREFAEETYRAGLAALDLARAKAERQSRYLATYLPPTLAQTSEYPQRFTIGGLFAVFLLLSWSILVLIYYSIRDRG